MVTGRGSLISHAQVRIALDIDIPPLEVTRMIARRFPNNRLNFPVYLLSQRQAITCGTIPGTMAPINPWVTFGQSINTPKTPVIFSWQIFAQRYALSTQEENWKREEAKTPVDTNQFGMFCISSGQSSCYNWSISYTIYRIKSNVIKIYYY